MPEAVGKDGSAEFLDDDIAEIVLEGFGDPGDHGHTDQDTQVSKQGPYELRLGTDAGLMKDLVGVDRADLVRMGTQFVQQSSKEIGVEHGKGLVDRRQQQSQQYQPFIRL